MGAAWGAGWSLRLVRLRGEARQILTDSAAPRIGDAHWFVYQFSSVWLILVSRVRLLKKERHVPIVGVTPHVDLDEVTCAMVKVNDVRAVHHLQCRRLFPVSMRCWRTFGLRIWTAGP